MSLEVLRVIISLCAINSLEDTKGKWTELPVIERYQKECRVWYIDCYSAVLKKSNAFTGESDMLNECIRKRSP